MKLLKSKHGHDVRVHHSVQTTQGGLHVIEINAQAGSTFETRRVTIGADDGDRVKTPTTEQMQSILDRHRQQAADEASWKEAARTALEGVA